MLKRSLLLPLLGPALLLGGCGGTINRGLESVHQPVVARQDYLLDLRTAGDGLATGETGRLAGWLGSMRLGYGDKVAIDDPNGAYGVREDVAHAAAHHGVLLADDRPITDAPVAPGTVRVVVSRMKAFVPGCPDFSRDSSIDYNQNTSSNFGCATNSSLAAMIAEPEDLVHGHGTEITDLVRASRAIATLGKAGTSGGSAATGASGASGSSSAGGGK